MQMIRTFNSVGQGAFYTECFENGSNIVYDCGTLSSRRYLKKEIDRQFGEKATIEAVFISHLHSDHCNGLEYLLKRCNVSKIFLPLLTPEERILALLKESITHGRAGFVWEFIRNPEEAIRNMGKETKIVLVSPSDSEAYREEQGKDAGSIRTAAGVISSGTELEIAYCRSKWIYVPFYFRQQQYIKDMKADLAKEGLAFPKTGEEVKTLWETKEAVLRKVYDKVTGGKTKYNGASMVVYSGPYDMYEESDAWAQRYYAEDAKVCREAVKHYVLSRGKWYGACGLCPAEFPAGCLYTGDYDAKASDSWEELACFTEPYRSQIGCCQLPHHGSVYNYNSRLKEFCKEYVISCGRYHRFSHPDGEVLRDLLLDGKKISVVTEKTDSRRMYIIDGWDR